MSEHYKVFEPKLKFFGTMNGASKMHTNAFFCPDEETIVFLDMSILNAYEAEDVLRARPELKNFYACLTHNHYDHASGLEKLAYDIQNHHPGSMLTVITDNTLREETVAHFDSVGMRPITIDGCKYEVYNLLAFERYNSGYVFHDRTGSILPTTPRPLWFVRTIPTTHSPRLKSCGFACLDQGTLIVYSGDTNQLEPYMCFLRDMLDGIYTDHGDPPIEFYLDVSTRKNPLHLNFREIASELKVLLDEYTTMKLILMHCDDLTVLKQELDELMPEMLGDCVFIAKKTF